MLSCAGLTGAMLVGGDVNDGAWIAKQADAYNRQLHKVETKLAESLAELSEGRYSAVELEEALRALPNSHFNEQEGSNIVVDLQDPRMLEDWESLYYDQGGKWMLLPDENGDPRYMIQMPQAQLAPEINDFIVTSTGGENSPYYRAPLAVESVFQEEKGFSPIKLSLELGGKEYSMSAVSREQACAATNAQCLLTLGSSPLHIGLIPVEQDGVTYYLNKYDPVVGPYINKLNEVTYQGVADAATLATVVFPKASPVSGPVAIGATAASIYYSDDPAGKVLDVIVGRATGKIWDINLKNAGAPVGQGTLERFDAASGYLGGTVSQKIREGE